MTDTKELMERLLEPIWETAQAGEIVLVTEPARSDMREAVATIERMSAERDEARNYGAEVRIRENDLEGEVIHWKDRAEAAESENTDLHAGPVAWGTAWQTNHTGDEWHFARKVSFARSDLDRGIVRNVTPLYAAPPASAPAVTGECWSPRITAPLDGTRVRLLVETEAVYDEHNPALLMGGWRRVSDKDEVIGWRPARKEAGNG